MGRQSFWNHFWSNMGPENVSMSKAPLIELYGGKRILIENHCGVLEYADNSICIKVNCGQVCVSGCNLNLTMMSRERLVICGKIESVHIKEM